MVLELRHSDQTVSDELPPCLDRRTILPVELAPASCAIHRLHSQ
jgi:hypothetical protein